nr:isoprenylcysteine carboxylmethyltransferase family protein [Pseudonocardia acidicola]
MVGAVVNHRRAPRVVSRASGTPWLVIIALAWLVGSLVPRAAWRPVTYGPVWLTVVGSVVLLLSTGFTLWARWRLGTMWTATATIKADHRLRTDGPYAITRHPIYTGLLGMLIGTALMNGLGVWLVLPALGFVAFAVKIHAEERLLTGHFPGSYQAYRDRVPQLVPGVRRSRSRDVAAGSSAGSTRSQ